ncbi:ATV_HP_G0159010.mRNA.1.CDS.1 [Saccharomyces cerevisiae]|nr:ATV_HP_G0159010.mRNA.1.CDS.1 [Saccharomyces cerevisiae]CAI6938345.1 ATV_HP_G0159010.mRNA.1.CDS.1 [Saccharomyces cerevisiae]
MKISKIFFLQAFLALHARIKTLRAISTTDKVIYQTADKKCRWKPSSFDRSEPKNVSVKVLDQLLLPYTTKYVPIHTIDDGYSVIKSIQVRGAPAIAVVGSLSVLTGTINKTQPNF